MRTGQIGTVALAKGCFGNIVARASRQRTEKKFILVSCDPPVDLTLAATKSAIGAAFGQDKCTVTDEGAASGILHVHIPIKRSEDDVYLRIRLLGIDLEEIPTTLDADQPEIIEMPTMDDYMV